MGRHRSRLLFLEDFIVALEDIIIRSSKRIANAAPHTPATVLRIHAENGSVLCRKERGEGVRLRTEQQGSARIVAEYTDLPLPG